MIPWVRLKLRVLGGEYEDRRAFVPFYMGAKNTVVDKKTGKERQRSESEYASVMKMVKAKNKAMLEALEVAPGMVTGEGAEKVFSFYDVDNWEGRTFCVQLSVTQATEKYDAGNMIQKTRHVDDPKFGLHKIEAQYTTV